MAQQNSTQSIELSLKLILAVKDEPSLSNCVKYLGRIRQLVFIDLECDIKCSGY